jgi:hypothetical protein
MVRFKSLASYGFAVYFFLDGGGRKIPGNRMRFGAREVNRIGADVREPGIVRGRWVRSGNGASGGEFRAGGVS